jgi:hypothetical protein
MPPFVLSLLSQGLGLLGNAVLSKGKDVIEEKLGINIEQAMMSDEGKQKLLQLQNDHEEFLLTNATENRKIDLQQLALGVEEKKIDVDNTKNARDSNTKIQESQYASFLAKNAAYIIDFVIVIATVLLITLMYFKGVPTENKEIAFTAVGALLTMCGTILNFHRGSSSGSKSANATIATLSGAQK